MYTPDKEREEDSNIPNRPLLTEIGEQGVIRLIVAMRDELIANQHKGHWDDWTPSRTTIYRDLDHHLGKLADALHAEDKLKVTEHCGDIANLLAKCLSLYGRGSLPESTR